MKQTSTDQDIQIYPQFVSQKQRLIELLTNTDLDFHDQVSQYASHNFHSFPAKFPPQLPKLFIENLTSPRDLVLDPMQGSGTTIVEAFLSDRRSIGFDIDPLANFITQVKTTPLNTWEAHQLGQSVLQRAADSVQHRSEELKRIHDHGWDPETREFIDYWFSKDVQIELVALVDEIEKIPQPAYRNFLMIVLSAIIITKTGGVSLALDLAHTRPHRAKLIYSRSGEIIEGEDLLKDPPKNLVHTTKILRSPIEEFKKRIQINLNGLTRDDVLHPPTQVIFGNAQNLPLAANTIDLIVTSPPYASNAIDYMRAHKFSLVWFGYPIRDLSERRKGYIGSEGVAQDLINGLPEFTSKIVSEVSELDIKKGAGLQRYYTEMACVLREMYRVMKPGKCAIVVVGTSDLRGKNTQTQNCLAEIGAFIGFEVPAIGIRNLDRDRRMMPAGGKLDLKSQIQKRMHEEYVIGFYKPE